jgi:hypothetical protein
VVIAPRGEFDIAGVDIETLNFETPNFVANDVVIYTVARIDTGLKIVSATLAESETLRVTTITGAASFVAGGETFRYSRKQVNAVPPTFGDIIIFFDNYRNPITTDAVDLAGNYAVIIAAGSPTDGWGVTTHNVRLLRPDGSLEEVRADAPMGANVGRIVEVRASTTPGLTNLLLNPAIPNASVSSIPASNLDLVRGRSAFTWNNVTYITNANTLFLVRTGTTGAFTYTPYTGIGNVPSLSGNNVVGEVLVNTRNGFARVVYITESVPTDAAVGVIYLTGTTTTTAIIQDVVRGSYWIANAVIDGEVATVELRDGLVARGVYTRITYDAHGIGSATTALTAPVAPRTATGIRVVGGVIVFDSVAGGFPLSYGFVENVPVFYISAPAGVPSVSSVAEIVTSTTDTITFTLNNSDIITAVFIQRVPAS